MKQIKQLFVEGESAALKICGLDKVCATRNREEL